MGQGKLKEIADVCTRSSRRAKRVDAWRGRYIKAIRFTSVLGPPGVDKLVVANFLERKQIGYFSERLLLRTGFF